MAYTIGARDFYVRLDKIHMCTEFHVPTPKKALWGGVFEDFKGAL